MQKRKGKIPLGIMVLGTVLAALIGASAGIYSTLVFGQSFWALKSTVLFIAGIVSLVLAYGLWKGDKWSWWFGLFVSAILILTIFTFDFVSFAIGLILAYYLLRKGTRKYFRMIEAQSVIEYLTTYGWAFLFISIIAIALYFYLAVPTSITSNACNFSNGVSCSEIIIGTNTVTHNTTVGLFLVNSQQYNLERPALFAKVNGRNSSAVACSPNFVLEGGTILCILNLGVNTTPGSFISGSFYLNATSCTGVSQQVGNSCTNGLGQTYLGNFDGHTEPVAFSEKAMVTMSVVNYTPSANGNPDSITAYVTILGKPLGGATVNFSTNSTQFVVSPNITTTNGNGEAVSGIQGTTSGKVNVTVSYAGIVSNVIVNFTAAGPLYLTFAVRNINCTKASNQNLISSGANSWVCTQLSGRGLSFAVKKGSAHSYYVEPIGANYVIGLNYQLGDVLVNGVQYPVNQGTPSYGGNVIVTANTTVLAYYYPEYLLSMTANGPGAVTASPGLSFGAGTYWENVSSKVKISAVSNSGHTFTSWSCSGSGCYTGPNANAIVYIGNNEITETARFT